MEISKLRQRLKNVKKNVVEYRMTVAEANALLAEIDIIISTPPAEPITVFVSVPTESSSNKDLDGGSF